MNDQLMNYLANPTKCKLILEVETKGQVTAKMLAKSNGHIPQATLYRYLKKMVSDGILRIAEERQVRNVTEKIYELAIDFQAGVEEMLANNSGEAYFNMFQQFTMGLLNEFRTYADQEDIDLLNDGSGFRISPFYATYDELKELSLEINKLIQVYRENESTPERKARSVAIVFTPPISK